LREASPIRAPTPISTLLAPRLLWLAIRPRTLSLALAPVLAGSALAWSDGAALHGLRFAVALLCALCIQAATNLFNDAADAEAGNDGPDRVGPTRLTGSGLATAGQVRRSAWLLFAAAGLGGAWLVIEAGWPILVIGVASLAAGWAYSRGPLPLSHAPWGELFVLLFFGLVAVGGSYYLQYGRFSAPALGVGAALGLHAAAVLLVNNLRDLEADRRAGRRTLAGLLGPQLGPPLYALLLLLPFPLLALVLGPARTGVAWLALPFCAWLAWRFSQIPGSRAMNRQLVRTAQAQLLFGGLLAATLLFGPA
jgi:1,4-dihydroxy-2-naphthoate octaprenyltransferase